MTVNHRVVGSSPAGGAINKWRGVRVAEGTGLENQRGETYRGFESHPLRHTNQSAGVRSYRQGHPVVTRKVAGSSPAAPATLKDYNALCLGIF